MSDQETMLDKLLIRELYGRMATASASKNAADWLACWSDDAVWQTPHFERTGKAAIQQQWDLIWADFDKVAVLNEVGPCEIAEGTARAQCCVLEVITTANGSTFNMAGLYEDEFVRQNGEWRFRRRSYSLISHTGAGG